MTFRPLRQAGPHSHRSHHLSHRGWGIRGEAADEDPEPDLAVGQGLVADKVVVDVDQEAAGAAVGVEPCGAQAVASRPARGKAGAQENKHNS